MTATARHSLVTGGGGFVGRALVDALRQRGDRVTVVELRGEPHRPDIDFVRADIRDGAAIERALAGVDTVFHNASLVHTKHNREDEVWGVNLGGSQEVLRACQRLGISKLIYVSSASAVYEGRDIENGDETLPYSRISQAPYSDSKIAAEKEILAANGAHGVATCALRPHVIFGPGDTRFIPRILERARAGSLRFSVGLFNRKLSDFTYIDNLVDALLLADDKLALGSPVAGQPYFVTNGEPAGFFDFVRRFLALLELPPIRFAVPYPLVYGIAAIAESIDTLRGGTLNNETGMTRFAIRYMCTHHYFNIGKAQRELGYRPAVSLEEGLRRTAEHVRRTGA
jgi:sterol-4alpha-carboxylate 3-dehydrogenase (decarboxylating)